MSSCCYSGEYADVFGHKGAEREARRYVKRGLRGSERTLASALRDRAASGASILEVGGGVGALQVELLRAGAVSATNVELSPEWEPAARRLLDHFALTGRAGRRVGDFVDAAGDLPQADVVVLHRVVCCYPHWRRMLEAAAGRARRTIALTFPVDRMRTRAVLALGNWLLKLRGRSFRAFVHPPDEMLAALREQGFGIVGDESGLVWRSVVLERAG